MKLRSVRLCFSIVVTTILWVLTACTSGTATTPTSTSAIVPTPTEFTPPPPNAPEPQGTLRFTLDATSKEPMNVVVERDGSVAIQQTIVFTEPSPIYNDTLLPGDSVSLEVVAQTYNYYARTQEPVDGGSCYQSEQNDSVTVQPNEEVEIVLFNGILPDCTP